MQADLNGDGVIDFEEFMKHFSDLLNMIEFEHSLQEKYLEELDFPAAKQVAQVERQNFTAVGSKIEAAKLEAQTV